MNTELSKKIPENDQEAWLKYPKINWLYDTARLLEFQKIRCYPFPIDGVTHTNLAINSMHGSILREFGAVYIEPKIDICSHTRTKVDLIIHKGTLVHEVFYTENLKGDIELLPQQDSGQLELKIIGLLTWYLNKFCGVISVEYEKNVIIAVRLKPNDKAESFYPHVIYSKLKALYTRRQWTHVSLKEQT